MPYRIQRKESVPAAVRRIAREQAEAALIAATRNDVPTEKRVHEARTCCKKLRGLLRLVRKQLGDVYGHENAFVRDAARALSASRDAAVVLKAFDGLGTPGEIDRKTRKTLRGALLERLRADDGDDEDRLAAFTVSMRALLANVDGWHVRGCGFRAVREGLDEQYSHARRAMRRALDDGDSAEWHEWRKPAKYHWYHVRLLRGVWRPAMAARASALSELADLLGEDHDHAVLRTLASEVDLEAAGTLVSLIDQRRSELQSLARPLGQRLFAEKPREFTKRVRRYWNVWRGC